MRQTGGGERLAGGALAVFSGGKRDHLDGDLTVEQLVVGAPHHPEAAGAEELEQAIATQRWSAPSGRRPLAASSGCDTPAAALRGDQCVVIVHRLLRSPVRGRSLPRAGRRSGG